MGSRELTGNYQIWPLLNQLKSADRWCHKYNNIHKVFFLISSCCICISTSWSKPRRPHTFYLALRLQLPCSHGNKRIFFILKLLKMAFLPPIAATILSHFETLKGESERVTTRTEEQLLDHFHGELKRQLAETSSLWQSERAERWNRTSRVCFRAKEGHSDAKRDANLISLIKKPKTSPTRPPGIFNQTIQRKKSCCMTANSRGCVEFPH